MTVVTTAAQWPVSRAKLSCSEDGTGVLPIRRDSQPFVARPSLGRAASTIIAPDGPGARVLPNGDAGGNMVIV
ncbi:MAG: hypothetical protein ABII12_08720 [Planctomycetota bacterium]